MRRILYKHTTLMHKLTKKINSKIKLFSCVKLFQHGSRLLKKFCGMSMQWFLVNYKIKPKSNFVCRVI